SGSRSLLIPGSATRIVVWSDLAEISSGNGGMEIVSPNQAPDDSIGADLFEYEVSTWSGSDRVTSWQTRFLLSVATRSLPLPVLTTSRQRQIKTPRRFHGGGVCFLTYYVERGLCRRQSGWHAESDEILAARMKAGCASD